MHVPCLCPRRVCGDGERLLMWCWVPGFPCRRDIIGNRFEGAIPDLSGCESLQNIYFKHNMLTGDLRSIRLPPTVSELYV